MEKYLSKFIEKLEKEGKSINTIKAYKLHMQEYFKWFADSFGNTEFKSLYRSNIQEYKNYLKNIKRIGKDNHNLDGKTINAKLSALSKFSELMQPDNIVISKADFIKIQENAVNPTEITKEDVTSAVGGGYRESSNGKGNGGKHGSGNSGSSGKGSESGNDSLTDSIVTMGQTTQETLGEAGGEGTIGKFEEFGGTIAKAESHVQGVIDKLNEVDGMHAEATITINIETNGSIPSGFGLAEGTAFDSGSTDFVAKYGAAHVEGTALASGNWAVQPDEKSALMGEIGYEIIVRNGRFFTVGENGAEMVPIKKGDIVFNHEQSEALLKNGHISGRGKAYADGTVGDKFASGVCSKRKVSQKMPFNRR